MGRYEAKRRKIDSRAAGFSASHLKLKRFLFDRHRRGVQADRSGRGRQAMGSEEEQDQHELRQIEPRVEVREIWKFAVLYVLKFFFSQILLRQVDHDEGAWQALCLQVRLPWVDGRVSLTGARLRRLQFDDPEIPSALADDVERLQQLRQHVR